MDAIEALPIDMIIEILLKLPAKSLIRFKCVCKLWYIIIINPYFAKHHLQISLAKKCNLYFVARNPALYIADFDTFDNPIELNYLFKAADHGGVSIIGSCNGLLCLWSYDYLNFNVFVLNPTTRTFNMLPYLPRSSHVVHLKHNFIDGFGYDSVTDDYKFVKILQCYSKEDPSLILYSELMVYSMRANCWTKVLDQVPIRFKCRREDGVLVNENLHWVIDIKIGEFPHPIVSFDLSTYSFGEVPVPEIVTKSYYCYMHVGELDGCLCSLVNYVYDVEIFVMKDYGAVESWAKLIRVVKTDTFINMERTLGFWRNKRELLVRVGFIGVASIDLETKVIEDLSACGLPVRRFHYVVCVENLLMLDYYSDYFENEEQSGDNKKRRRRRRKKRRGRNRR